MRSHAPLVLADAAATRATWQVTHALSAASTSAGPILGPMPHGPMGPLPGIPSAPGAPAMLTSHFHRFFSATRQGPVVLPPLPQAASASLSVGDKCRIRDRATILARQVGVRPGSRRVSSQQQQKVVVSVLEKLAALFCFVLDPGIERTFHNRALPHAQVYADQGEAFADQQVRA